MLLLCESFCAASDHFASDKSRKSRTTCNANLIIINARQRSCGIVMFSLLSVCSQGGPHVNITQNALDFTVQAASPLWTSDLSPSQTSDPPSPLGHQIWDSPGPSPLLVTSVRPVQTCSLEDSSSTSTDIWWLPLHVRLASGRYATY